MGKKVQESDVVLVNRILMDTIEGTFFYARQWDPWAKPKAFNHMAWDNVPKFAKLVSKLTDPVLSKTVANFLEVCRIAKEENPKLHSMESDAAFKAFEVLVSEVNNSEAAKAIKWPKKEPLVTPDFVQTLKGVLDELAKETKETRESHQLATPGVTVIE